MKLIIEIPDYNLNDIQNGSIACSQVLKAVKNGVPYEERPQGEWVDGDEEYSYYANCSCCGYQIDTHEIRGYYNFCPNCGADMRGGNSK